MQMDTTVLGGLPVTIEYQMQPAEPDVGIMSAYVDDWRITYVAGKRCKTEPEWIYKRITDAAQDKLLEECGVHYDQYEPDYSYDD